MTMDTTKRCLDCHAPITGMPSPLCPPCQASREHIEQVDNLPARYCFGSWSSCVREDECPEAHSCYHREREDEREEVN